MLKIKEKESKKKKEKSTKENGIWKNKTNKKEEITKVTKAKGITNKETKYQKKEKDQE